MQHRLGLLLLVSSICAQSFGSDLVSESEVIGCWKVDPSTFYVQSRITPNSFPPPQLRTNLLAFELWLRTDHSFVASNVQAALDFDWPTTNECSGMWEIRTNWSLLQKAHRVENGVTNWVVSPGPNATNGYSELRLEFSKPSLGFWTRRLTRDDSEKPKYYLFGKSGEDETRAYEWFVLLRKQNTNDKK